jgi:hypothetical protein
MQRSLIRRATDLERWDNELTRREDLINGRRSRNSRFGSTTRLPGNLLSTSELYAWETRLDRQTRRLQAREEALRQRERRINRSRNRTNDRRDQRNNNRGGNNGDYCPPGWG